MTLMLSGCAGQAFVQGPYLNMVCVSPVWSTKAEIQAKCGNGTAACGHVGTQEGQVTLIFAEKPASFDDPRTCTLGHELLHNLGATHETR